ncbi:MAG: hypothetical protein H6Q03_3021, partial [Acidobacteria bacterium]|nr:hypothetical protein [Acidobacteriota bacterium]
MTIASLEIAVKRGWVLILMA